MYITFESISLPKTGSILFVIVKSPINTKPIKGPTYGIMLSNAHKKAITSALFIPITESIIEYSINSIVICTEMPMKYLESNI